MIQIIESAWEDRSLLDNQETIEAIEQVVDDLDKGKLRVAEPVNDGWKVNDWVKKAVIFIMTLMPVNSFLPVKWKR